MRAAGGQHHLDIRLEVDDRGRRSYSVNTKNKRRVADVRGHLPCVVFTPDDLGITKGSAETRRNLLDSLGDQLSRNYEALRREYERVLRQRNAALKSGQAEVAKALAEKLVDSGARYVSHRRGLLENMEPHAREAYSRISGGEKLSVTYEMRGAARLPEGLEETRRVLEQCLEKSKEEEERRGTTTIGPHRDDIVFEVDRRRAREFSSQGQQRSAALAWKLAEVQAVQELASANPLLLLDDVMSELDERRREALVELVDQDIQTVVTTTNPQYFTPKMIKRAQILELAG
jgi:DNA replication and repair protein RecF